MGPPLGPGGEDITWPDQVAPRGQKVSSTCKIKPQTSNLFEVLLLYSIVLYCIESFVPHILSGGDGRE